MSSTGVRESNSNNRRVIKGLILNEAQFIQSLRVFANTSTISGLGATEGEINNSPTEASGNYLSRLGDTMLGPLALSPPLDFRIEIDANNTIDIGPLNDNAQYTSNVQLDSIQPNSFVLDIIAGAAFDGQILVLRTFAPSTPFTISQGTLGNGGNIQTGDGNDLTVGDLQVATLIFDEALKIEANTGGSWRVLSVSSGGGGGGISFPIDFPEDDRGTVGASTQDILFTDADRHSVKMIVSDDVDLSFSSPPTNETAYTNIIIVQDGTGGHTVTVPPGTINKAIVDAGILTGPDEETGIVIKFAFGIFYAFLETGNVVSGGSLGANTELSNLVSPTAINQNLLFGTSGLNVGSQAVPVDSIFTNMLLLDGNTGIGLDIFGITIFANNAGNTIDIRANTDIEMFVNTVSRFKIDTTELELNVDLNMKTFDIFDIDQVTFKSTVGTLFSLNVGFGALGSGSFRANILNNGRFEWTEENTELMRLSEASSITTLSLTGILSSQLQFGETTTGKTGSILQGTVTLQYTTTATQHEFLVGVESIAFITASGIEMQGTNFIITPQIGFSILGNIIEDDVNGMKFKTVIGDDFEFSDGTDIFATLDKDLFALQFASMMIPKIGVPTDPPSNLFGKVFYNTADNRLSFIRRNDGDTAFETIDLESGGTDLLPLTNVWTGINTFTNQVNLNSTVVLGDEVTDLIQGVGRLARDWLPSTDLGNDLGSIDNTWGSLYSRNIFFDDTAIKIQKSGSDMIIETSSGNDIVFREATTEFVRMDGGLDQVTFLRETEFNANVRIDGGNMILAHDSAQCGFAVTDEVTSPGTEGTMQMPRTSDTTPTAAELDADFGSAIGCHGLATLGGLPATPLFVIKVGTSPSIWRGFLMFPSGNTTAIEFT